MRPILANNASIWESVEMTNYVEWSSDLFNAYHRLDAQYSSYPAIEYFQQDITAFERFSALRASRQAQRPLALSVNIPFCANACYDCTTKNIVTKDRSRSTTYIRSLEQEIRTVAQHIRTEQPIEQLHFGGGTPTFLNPSELRQVMDCLKDNFNISSNNFAQYSIDIDPRETDWATIGVLRDIGFNRVNIEVQGLDPEVQRAINRLQSFEQIQTVVDAARTLQFRTLSISLIYGLPKQTPASFAQALSQILKLAPDRIVLAGYKHQPDKHPIQKRIYTEDLPDTVNIELMLKTAQQKLSDAGYRYIGMGNFALADDDFATAQEDGILHHSMQGYSTCTNCDSLGFGVSAISQLGDLYYHNSHDLNAYQTACNNQLLAPAHGLICKADDKIRRSIIQALTCQFAVNFASIKQQHNVDIKELFSSKWPELELMHKNGLVILTENDLQMTKQGRLFTLAVCQLFDHYLEQDIAPKAPITQAI